MKVLHVLDISMPKLAGYTTRSYHLVNNQKKLGMHPVVLTSERFGSTNTTQEKIDGITYYRTPVKNSFIRKLPLVAELDEVKCLQLRIAEVVEEEGVDIIHAHSPSLLGAASIPVCKKNGIPLVYEIRAFWEDAAVDRGAFKEGGFKYLLRRFHETQVTKKSSAVIAICEGIRNDFVVRGIADDKIYIVRNGVDCNIFKPVIPDVDLKNKLNLQDKIILGFIGSFFNFEGLQDLIIAMEKIVAKNNKIVLLLVGKGQMDACLRDLTVKLGLEQNIFFAGQVSHDHVNNYYSIIDILVYPRIKKRITELVTPLKPLEAMAMEKPVLMSDVGGLKELADVDGVATFYKAGDIDDLVDKCLSLCDDEPLRLKMAKKSCKNVKQNWGWDRRAETDILIYQQLFGAGWR